MKILGITTSSPVCGIALWSEGAAAGSDKFPGARSCVEELMPRIEGLLSRLGAALRDIDLLAVDVGPGGLTGLKIGIVAARTLAQALDKPIVGVSAMEAMCEAARRAGRELLLPLVKCSGAEFFSAVYRNSGGRLECVAEERLDTVEGLAGRLAGFGGARVLAMGDSAARADEAAAAAGLEISIERGGPEYPAAESVCRLAERRPPSKYAEIAPRYLCLTNAERKFGIRA